MRSISDLFRKRITFRKAVNSRITPTATRQQPSIGLANVKELREQPVFEEKTQVTASSISTLEKPLVASPLANGQQMLAPAADDFPLYEIGDLISERYQVMQRLEGAMAYLYVAYDKTEDINFAIKQPKQAMLADPVFSSRISKAANAWTGLGMHPHIAHCYFVRQIDDVPHLFIEYVEGNILRKWIELGACTDLHVSLDLAIQFCHGMERAHGCDLIHRDIKPENILITPAGMLQITDFGINSEGLRYADLDNQSPGAAIGVESGIAMGTLAYMAPEQLRDPRQRSDTAPNGVWYDSDIYSFGVCLWEMILGQLPYNMVPSVEDAPPDPLEFRRDIPDSLRSLLRDVIAIDRSVRPQDFRLLRESLNKIYQALFSIDAPSNKLQLPEDTAADELNNLGCEYLERNDIAQARSCFESAIKKGLTHPQAAYNLALIQWRLGEISEDDVLWRLENCKIDPTVEHQVLAELIAQIQAERLDPDSAKGLLMDYPGRYEALFGNKVVGQAKCLHTLEGHSGWINCVAMTADGNKGLSGSDDQTLRLWNLVTGDCLCTLEGHNGRINAIALTPDGCWGLSGSDDRTLRLWDLNTGTNTHILEGHESDVTSVALSADCSLALSGSKDKTLVLWDLKTGERVRTLAGHTGWVRSVAMTPDGRWGLSGSNDNTLRFWDLKAGKCIGTSEENVRGIKTVAIADDGRTGLCGSREGTLCLWNLENGEHLGTLEGHTMSVESVALTADTQWALSASRDTTLRLWELETGQCIQVKKGQRGFVLSLATTPDGQRVISGNHDNTIQVWELPLHNRYRASFRIARHRRSMDRREPEIVDRLPLSALEDSHESAALEHEPKTSKENKTIVAMDLEPTHGQDDSQEAQLMDLVPATGQEYFEQPEVMNQQPATKLKDSQDPITDTIAWVTLRETWKSQEYLEDASIVSQYNQLLAKGHATNLLRAKTLRRLDGNNGGFFAIVQSHDGHLGLSGNADATLGLWNLETGENLRSLRGHTDLVSSVAMTHDGRLGLSASADSTLRLWDLNTGECLCILGENSNAFLSVAMTPDGHWAISGQRFGFTDESDLLSLWDLQTRKLVCTWEGHRDQVRSVALTPDGHWGLSGGADNTLRLWNLKTHENVHTMKGHTQAVNAVAITADGRWGLSGSHDATLRLWDLQTGACVCELIDHSEPIRSVALTSDGRRGFSGSFDKSLKLWNLATGECLETLQQHTEYVTSVDLSLDGCLGLSASVDNTLLSWRFIWDLELPDR